MLASRSLHLPELKTETLDRLYRDADAKITRRGLTILSYVENRRLRHALTIIKTQQDLKDRPKFKANGEKEGS